MSKSGTTAGSGSGAGRSGRPGIRAAADAHRSAKGPPDARAVAIKAKLDARVRAAELGRRRDMHDGKGGLNAAATPAMKAAAARMDRTIHRSGRHYLMTRDAAASLRKKGKS